MAVPTDRLGLSNHNLFKIVRDSFKNTSLKTQNILECKDDMLFVWNPEDSCVLTLNLKIWRDEAHNSVSHQTLQPTEIPSLEVERLRSNQTGTQLALLGPHGVAVMELPRRWGKDGGFLGGKPAIVCRCRNVDQRYWLCNQHVEVRSAQWHPDSDTDSLLLVLASNNTFRLYDTLEGEPALLSVWVVGRQPVSSLPFLAGLGDTAVDFTFTPPQVLPARETGTQTQASLQWPILVLHGNGDVYCVMVSISSDRFKKPIVQGPLSMFPPADDNYGVDSCSILCLHTQPPVVVIASCSGTLYHCILLNHSKEIGKGSPMDIKNLSLNNSTYNFESPDVALHVFEAVELELGISLNDTVDLYTCPIFLHHDVVSDSRYFCSHDTGIHIVFLPLVSQLKSFLNTSDDNMTLALPSFAKPSVVEYLVCTRAASSQSLVPVLGTIQTPQPPSMLVALLAGGEVVSLAVASIPLTEPILTPVCKSDEVNENVSPLKMMLKEPFDLQIKNLLKRNITQPILKLGPEAKPSPMECMELLNQTTLLLREEYFLKHDRVREEIERRVCTLRLMKERQLKELSELEKEKSELKQKAEQLAEKYEDTKDRQEELTKVAENILRQVIRQQPSMTTVEKKFIQQLKEVEETLKVYKRAMEQVKIKESYHKNQVIQWQAQQKTKEMNLGPSRIANLKIVLSQMSEDISQLGKTINAVKRELSL